MVHLVDLWLPILLSAVAVFVASALAWMVMPHHKQDHVALPDMDRGLDSVRALNLQPGQYYFPLCGEGKSMTEAQKEAFARGPHGFLMILPGPPNMGRCLGLSIALYLVVSLLAAYLATMALNPGAGGWDVFRVVATASFLAYGLGGIPHGIWYGRRLRTFLADFVDAVVYSALTGGIFVWLWPQAPVGILPG